MSRARLTDLLRNEILNLDLAELDFGVYRILNYRRAEVEEFFDRTLPDRIKSAVAESSDVTEDQICNALYTFFRRHYRDGDFIPQSRRSQHAKYSIPYNGEDTLLYWRGRGTHYVKTTEELSRYRFTHAGWTITCQLVDAEADELPGRTRYFVPIAMDALPTTRDLVISFVFRALTTQEAESHKSANAEDGATLPVQASLLQLVGTVLPLPAQLSVSALQTDLLRYARKNREDYFVHPELRGFLGDELEYFVRNEVLDIAANHQPLASLVLELGREIVEFLADLEDLQARLFEKPKFVLGASYWVQIRLVPKDLWLRILESESQIAEWQDLFAVPDGIDIEYLENHPSLIVDTSLHPRDLKWEILGSFEDIDEVTDGLAVKSENYAALRTLLPSLRGRVRLSYNDPPYNTGKDEFLYKDDFSRSSTWLTMMDERVRLVCDLLADDGVFVCSIADHEQARLKLLCDDVFTAKNFVSLMIWVNEGNIDNQSQIKGNHEYLTLYSKNRELFEAPRVRDPNIGSDSKLSNEMIENTITKNGPKNPPSSVVLPVGFPAGFEEGVVEPGTTNWPKLSTQVIVKDWKLTAEVTATSGWSSRKLLDRFIESDFAPVKDLNGIDTRFAVTSTGAIYLYKPRPQDQSHVLSVMAGGVGSVQQMSAYLADMGFSFSYPKPLALVEYVLRWQNASSGWFADFFAGSGTTGEAVIRFNREGLGSRRFLLVEMAHYFDQILAPRIKRVMYSPTWAKGMAKPEPKFGRDQQPEWVTRSPRLVKVLRLESYEDSLDALETSHDDGSVSLFQDQNVLKYVISTASRSAPLLSAEALETPDSYQLRVHTPMGLQEMDVDLVETFNLVAGARVRRVIAVKDGDREYLLLTGEFDGRDSLVVWRDVDDLDPERERAFLETACSEGFGRSLDSFSVVLHNADAAIPGGESLDLQLIDAMRGAPTDG